MHQWKGFCASEVGVLCIRGRGFVHQGFCASGVGVLCISGRGFVHRR